MKKAIAIIILLLGIAGIGSCSLYNHLISKDYYNTGYVNGNTAGNLYNGGLFCEYDGFIYFSNPNDSNALYQMNLDGSGAKKVCDDSAAFINADDNYVYYTRTGDNSESQFAFLHINTHSLCKFRRDGKGKVVVLDTEPAMYASLVGNYLYYLRYDHETATTLYRVKNDGEDRAQIFPQPYFTCSTKDKYIYYNGLESDHNIYRLDTTNHTQSLVYEGNCWMPIIEGNVAYFMDCENSYSLVKVDLSTGEKTILADDWVDCFNVHGNTIYFQRNSSAPAFCSVKTDGSDYTVLKEGVYTEIHVAGDLIFFKDYSSGTWYKMSVRDGWVSPFNPAVSK